MAEGFKVVDDLLALQPADLIVATQEWIHGKHFAAQTEVIEVTEEELKKVSFLQHPQQVLAVFRQDTGCNKQDSNNSQEEAEEKNFGFSRINTQELSLALDGVQDPGNLGTIIRIADWFGITHIYCSQDTADVYNPKVVQATMGSIASEGGIWQPAGSGRIAACRCTRIWHPARWRQHLSAAAGKPGTHRDGKRRKRHFARPCQEGEPKTAHPELPGRKSHCRQSERSYRYSHHLL